VGRIATGATLATFVLTGAAIAAASGRPGLMWALIAASIVVLLGTVANKARKLNRLPWIGAPRPVVTFKVNGSSALVVRLAKPDPSRLEEARTALIGAGLHGAEPTDRPEPRTAQIEVGVYNPSSFERIDRALVNFLLPVGLLRKKTDSSGMRREAGGEWLPTEDRVAGITGAFDYWSQDDVDFATGSAMLMFFEATFDEPGEYPIRLRISAPALYEKDYDTDAVIRVEIGDDGPVEKDHRHDLPRRGPARLAQGDERRPAPGCRNRLPLRGSRRGRRPLPEGCPPAERRFTCCTLDSISVERGSMFVCSPVTESISTSSPYHPTSTR
jgi:hypothetical protein